MLPVVAEVFYSLSKLSRNDENAPSIFDEALKEAHVSHLLGFRDFKVKLFLLKCLELIRGEQKSSHRNSFPFFIVMTRIIFFKIEGYERYGSILALLAIHKFS